MAFPLISVIIPTFNRARLVRRAVESVLAQDYPAKEVVVVDDASTDETDAETRPWAEALGVVWARHKHNRGEAASRNTGVRASRGEYLAFLDSDDYFLPGRLSSHMAVFAEHSGAAWAYSDYVFENATTHKDPLSSPPPYFPEGDIFEDILLQRYEFRIPVPVATIRRDLFDDIGGFDENLIHGVDLDFWLNAAKRGSAAHIFHVGSVVVMHDDLLMYSFPRERVMECYRSVLLRHANSEDFPPERRQRLLRELHPLLRRVSNPWLVEGCALLRLGRNAEARPLIAEAIRRRPLRYENYVYGILSLLPPPFYAALRRWKRSIFTQGENTP